MNLRTPLLCTASLLIGAGLSAAAIKAAETMKVAAPPAPMTVASLNAMALDPLPDIDWTPVESGTLRNAETVLFEGENTLSVWNAGPAKLILDEPLGYDEFVVVLKGSLTLTDPAGNSQTYSAGDMFMLPKEFMGTWDMTEEYRELIVVDTEAYNAE
ncbi:MAG: cupin domain-containing protein [Pseudomonadota bacterium]